MQMQLLTVLFNGTVSLVYSRASMFLAKLNSTKCIVVKWEMNEWKCSFLAHAVHILLASFRNWAMTPN